MVNSTDAKQVDSEDRQEPQKITDIHIGVFFDGTNNNMVQKARFTGTGKNILTKALQGTWNTSKKGFWYFADKTPFRDEEAANADLYTEYKKNGSGYSYTAISKGEKTYSNIGILHDNYILNCDFKTNDKKYGKNPVFKHFYIEGSGATDTSHFFSGNPNGLGFGLGNTGVTALVSKAVKYIYEYVESLGITNNENVTIHYYVFGFSRGATCARLFSRIATREPLDENKIERENEFAEHYAKSLFENGFLFFLNNKNKSQYYKRIIEFLGIYDTVVSIGFLKQKDGDVHPYLQKPYELAQNYKDNWHYKNVNDYGLNVDVLNVKNVCHICAMDEYRENFAITDVGSTVPLNAVEVFVPGCHSDVGGGYIDWEEEQEIVLKKIRQPNTEGKEGIKTWVGKINENPQNKYDAIDYISEKSLEKMGIIDKYWNDKSAKKEIEKGVPFTMRVIDSDSYIKFKRNVRGGYSNITLHMMIKYVNTKLGIMLFPNNILNYHIPFKLKTFGNNMINQMTSIQPFKRYWFFPKSYSHKYTLSLSENNLYRILRLEYIHFTCTSDIYHTNNPFNFKGVHTIEGTAGNLGNTPNFDETGKLCRIVYHGRIEDNKGNVSEDMHYMYDYDYSNIIEIDW